MGLVDLHCHLLPGVDDGPEDVAEAIEMARLLVQEGVERVVATPHASARYPTSPRAIREAARELERRLSEADVPLRIETGAEVSASLAADIDHETLSGLCLGRGRWLLLEPPTRATSFELHEEAETTTATHAKSPGGRRTRKAVRPAESSAAAGHRTGAHWSCPIESRHNLPPLTMLVIRFDPVFRIPGPGRHYHLPWPFPKFRPALCLYLYRHLFRGGTGRRDHRYCGCNGPCPSQIRALDPEVLFHLLLA